MKKIMLAAMAALAITGCSQNEEFDAPSQNAEIGVGAVVKNTTRAAITNNDNFKKFTVYSYITDNVYTPGTALGEAYMDGINYSFESAWTNDATEKYYWPTAASNKKIQFFAYPTDLIDSNSYTTPATGYPSFTFTVAAASADQKDLVVANKQDMASNSEGVTNGTFQLDFTHALTRINFAFVPADGNLTYTIESIVIKGVKGEKGKYTFANGWDLTNATEGQYIYPITQATSLGEGKNYFLLGNAAASLMLFPQPVTNISIEIKYKVANAKMDIFNDTKTISLSSASAWGAGQNILYKLTLPVGGDLVGITPEVSGWPNESETPIAPAN